MTLDGVSAGATQGFDVAGIWQQRHQAFQQLGQDLQAGNLTAARSDMAALQQIAAVAGASSGAPLSTTAATSGSPAKPEPRSAQRFICHTDMNNPQNP